MVFDIFYYSYCYLNYFYYFGFYCTMLLINLQPGARPRSMDALKDSSASVKDRVLHLRNVWELIIIVIIRMVDACSFIDIINIY